MTNFEALNVKQRNF